jgi:hypothetical protein
VSRPGEWNEPSFAATVCGSASLLVHVTVAPTATVKVAGLKAKSVIPTAVPPTGAVDPGVAGSAGDAIEPIPPDPMPGIPGVALTSDEKVGDGGAWLTESGAEPEQPVPSSRTLSVITAAGIARLMR